MMKFKMKFKKLNWLDIVLGALLVIMICLGGAIYFKSMGVESTVSNKTTVRFVVECNELHQEAAQQFQSAVGQPVIYGASKSDTGVVTDVQITPYRKITKNTQNGTYIYTNYADRYTALVTIEAEVSQTETEFRQDKEYVRIGAPMPVRGKGYASNGYIVELEEVAE